MPEKSVKNALSVNSIVDAEVLRAVVFEELLLWGFTMEMLNDEELAEHVRAAVKRFKGYVPTLEAAIGALYIARVMGWEVTYLMHSYSTIRKYEDLLEPLKFKEQADPNTDFSRKSYAWVWAKRFKKFWRVVRGQEPSVDRMQVDERLLRDGDVSLDGNRS